jgi:hypothetical protein
MIKIRHAAAFAASLALAIPVVAWAQNDPFIGGDYVEVTGVSIDDGHSLDYATFLTGYYKAQEQYAISQGWQTSYEILANVNKRKGEPDLFLVRRYKSLPDGIEGDRRAAMIRKQVKQDDAQMAAASGDRAKFRHIDGTMLLQELKMR